MSAQKKRLDEVGRPTEELQAAYDALIKFRPNQLTAVSVSGESVQASVDGEATLNPVRGGENGITVGMQSLLRQAASGSVLEWTGLRRPFDSALQPSIEKINAVRDFEVKKAAIEKKMHEREAAIIEEAEAHKPYGDRKREKLSADQHFEEQHRNVGGRPVNSFGHTWLYVLILFGVTSIEWLINYSAFFAWTSVPAIAAGFTIGMALAVALAAHVHGEYLKQRSSRFGPAASNKGRDISFLGLATLGLVTAVVVAGWARYSLAMHNIASSGPMITTTEGAPSVNPLTDVYFSLGINMIVWLIGLVISFMAHDEDYELMHAEWERWWCTRRFNRIHRPWEKRIQLAKAQGTKEIDQLRAATGLATESTRDQRNWLEQVDKLEESVYRTLAARLQPAVETYRIKLGNELGLKGHGITVGAKTLTGEQYKHLEITLDAAQLRKLLN